ncbi:MAG: hypothetical protein NZL91_07125 [Thermoflexales bacterium]|nr:hypothetical protein [Thermoflexales bacterium]
MRRRLHMLSHVHTYDGASQVAPLIDEATLATVLLISRSQSPRATADHLEGLALNDADDKQFALSSLLILAFQPAPQAEAIAALARRLKDAGVIDSTLVKNSIMMPENIIGHLRDHGVEGGVGLGCYWFLVAQAIHEWSLQSSQMDPSVLVNAFSRMSGTEGLQNLAQNTPDENRWLANLAQSVCQMAHEDETQQWAKHVMRICEHQQETVRLHKQIMNGLVAALNEVRADVDTWVQTAVSWLTHQRMLLYDEPTWINVIR